MASLVTLSFFAFSTAVNRRALDRKSTRLNSSHTVIYTLSLHDALPIYFLVADARALVDGALNGVLGHAFLFRLFDRGEQARVRSEEHTSELQSHSDLHSFPTRRSSDLFSRRRCPRPC